MINVGGLLFDKKLGVILVPEPDVIPFRSSTSNGTGVQITALRGPAFTLTLTRYDSAANIVVVQQQIVQRLGARVRIIDYIDNAPVDYLRPIFGEVEFVVTQARTIEAMLVPNFCGYRLNSSAVSYTPACKVVSQWTMYAVKA